MHENLIVFCIIFGTFGGIWGLIEFLMWVDREKERKNYIRMRKFEERNKKFWNDIEEEYNKNYEENIKSYYKAKNEMYDLYLKYGYMGEIK